MAKRKAKPYAFLGPPKFTSHGVPIEEFEREQRKLAKKRVYMERKVKNLVKSTFLNNGEFSKY